jgi:predicted NBD/HSP70 family sugar kinase
LAAVPLERLLHEPTGSGLDPDPDPDLDLAALPLFIDNGATTLGQAEMWFGAGRGATDAVVALVGSGVGAALVTGGSSYRGTRSSAGEWGHTTITYAGRKCRCGAEGCLEAYVGAEGVLERFQLANKGLPAPGGDEEEAFIGLLDSVGTSEVAAKVVGDTIGYLGAGFANLVNLFNPERIVIGGWVGLLLGPALLPRIRDAASAQALNYPFGRVSIELGRLGSDAVALGAATLVAEQFLTHGDAALRPRESQPATVGGSVSNSAALETARSHQP